jgi:hypothetical protein
VQDRRPVPAEGVDDDLVQRLGALAAAEDEQDEPLRRQPELVARLVARHRHRARRDRATGDAVARPLPPGDRERQEDAVGERRRQLVGKPEVRVGLRQRRG